MTVAAKINHRMRRSGLTRGQGAIYALAIDPHNVHCLTESHLDTWWLSLSAEDKAEIYEQRLGDAQERCRFCGCTQARACPGGCGWLDRHHTVCSAPSCAAKYNAQLFRAVFDIDPMAEFHGGAQTVVNRGAAPATSAPVSREQVDHFLRTGEWLSLGELDQFGEEVPDAAL